MNALLDRIDEALSFRRLFSLLLALLLFFSLTNTGVTVYAASDPDKAPTIPHKVNLSQVDTDLPIVVSMGDSFSAGEGIEDFYDQNLPLEEKIESADWLAHRSEKSWPGQLNVPGLSGELKDHRNKNWFFVAASGAVTADLAGKQNKEFVLGKDSEYDDSRNLSPQLDIFDQLPKNSVDYVTVTIGGNDVKFAGIIEKAVMTSSYFQPGVLSDMLAEIWNTYYGQNGVRTNIYKAYKAIQQRAGKQAQIIVAGYPQLLDTDGSVFFFRREEVQEINRAVSNFNIELERLVRQCADEDKEMKICFVPVEEAFAGHEAYTWYPYINPVYIGRRDEDLKNLFDKDWKWITKASAYSMHPNAKGAEVYADCVNKKIKQLQDEQEALEEQLALNPSDKEREIVLVLDRSGSMEGTPMRETIAAAKEFAGSVLAADANIGVVSYSSSATVCSARTDSAKYLTKMIDTLYASGNTNIEAGLELADEMLQNSNSRKKIIVLMSDGEPNVGKDGEELIAYADQLREKGYYIYTLGFFSDLSNKTAAYNLMKKIANPGCDFEITDAESLRFFFGDIADQVNGTKYFHIRIACPVDVTVSYNGETMTSKDNYTDVRTSFGSMTFEERVPEQLDEEQTDDEQMAVSTDNRIKILRLKEGASYDIKIRGNGDGTMNYSVSFMDDNGEYTDLRQFNNIPITPDTAIDTTVDSGDETYMYIDEDGDGKYDQTLRALPNQEAKRVTKQTKQQIEVTLIAVLVLTALAVAAMAMLLVRYFKIRKYL